MGDSERRDSQRDAIIGFEDDDSVQLRQLNLTLRLSGRGTARFDVLEIDVASYLPSTPTCSDRQSVLLGARDRMILRSGVWHAVFLY